MRLSIPIPGGDRDACLGAALVDLNSAIGNRTVVDDRTGKRFTVEFNGDAMPPTSTSPDMDSDG